MRSLFTFTVVHLLLIYADVFCSPNNTTHTVVAKKDITSNNTVQIKGTQVEASTNWQIDLDSSDRSEKIVTQCRLRPVNYWNYTLGRASVIVGHQFDSTIGSVQISSNDIRGEALPPLQRNNLRLVTILNPFFSHLRGNYIFVKKNKSPARLVDSSCSLVFIYAQWCPFSMRASPYINAIARAFPQLPVIAIDVDEYLRYRWSLRVFYVPKIKVFVGEHVYKEFNGTDNDLDELVDFVWQSLHLIPQGPLTLLKEDFLGPIPTQLLARPDEYRLYVAWIIFLLSFGYFIVSWVDCRHVLRQTAALLKVSVSLLDHRRYVQGSRNQRHVAALAALPQPNPRVVVSASTCTSYPQAD